VIIKVAYCMTVTTNCLRDSLPCFLRLIIMYSVFLPHSLPKVHCVCQNTGLVHNAGQDLLTLTLSLTLDLAVPYISSFAGILATMLY